jgi:hypothetical protein
MPADKKRQLAEFVIEKAFEPVMRARPDGRSDTDRRALQHVQAATKAEIDRYRHYESAAEVVTNFRRDLNSSAAKKIQAQLRKLRLPTVEDIRREFEAKAHQLGIKASA